MLNTLTYSQYVLRQELRPASAFSLIVKMFTGLHIKSFLALILMFNTLRSYSELFDNMKAVDGKAPPQVSWVTC